MQIFPPTGRDWTTSRAATSSDPVAPHGDSPRMPFERTPAQQAEASVSADASPQAAPVRTLVPEALADKDWRARVVHALVSLPHDRWGPVSCALAYRLLDRRDGAAERTAASGEPLNMQTQAGLLDLAALMAKAGFAVRADPLPEIAYVDGRFGVVGNATLHWAPLGAYYNGLWQAVLTAVLAPGETSVDVLQLSQLPGLLSQLVVDDPDFAVAAWDRHLAGNQPEFLPVTPVALGEVARRCVPLLAGAAGLAVGLAYRFAPDALHSAATAGVGEPLAASTELAHHAGAWQTFGPMAGALAAGTLEAAALVRLCAARPTEHDALALQRAQHLSAYALLVPSLTATALRQLVSKLGTHVAEADAFDVAALLNRRLDGVSQSVTPSDVISRIDWPDFQRKSRERRHPLLRYDTPGWVTALEAAVHLAYGMNVGNLWTNVVQEAFAQRRRDHWREEVELLDAQALASAPRRLTMPGDSPVAAFGKGVVHDWPRDFVIQRLQRAPVASSPMTWGKGMATTAGDARFDAMSPAQGLLGPMVDEVVSKTASVSLSAVLLGKWNRRWIGGGAIATAVTVTAKMLYGRLAGDRRGYRDDMAALGPPGAAALELRPRHHEPAVHQVPQLVSEDEDIATLDQMLRVIKSTDAIEFSAASIEKYRKEIQVTIAKEMGVVLRKLYPGAGFKRSTEQPWNATVEVAYDEWGRSTETERFSFSAGEKTTTHFTTFDIALGHHFLKEFSIFLGSKQVESVRALDDAAQKLLSAVDNDVFRTALIDHDSQQLERMAKSADHRDAYIHYVREVFTGVLIQHTSASPERALPPGSIPSRLGHPGHPGHQAIGQRQLFRIGHGVVRAVTFEDEVLPGLVAVPSLEDKSALLISVKHGTEFHWRPEVEATDAFREFMRSHLSTRQRQAAESPLRWDLFKYRIASTSVQSNRACGATLRRREPEPYKGGVDALYAEVSLNPSFKFAACASLELELWYAQLRRAAQERDFLIVSQAWRDERRASSVRHIVYDGLKLAGPALIAAFKGLGRAGFVMSMAYEIGPHVAELSELSHRATRAEVDELRRIHREMSLAESIAALLRIPNLGALDTAAEWVLNGLGRAPNVSQTLEHFMEAWPTAAQRRRAFAEQVRRMVKSEPKDEGRAQGAKRKGHPKAGKQQPEAPPTQPAGQTEGESVSALHVWQSISMLKGYWRISTDGEETVPMRDGERHVDAFLGAGRMQVTSVAQLNDLPEGYGFAFTEPDGTMFFAGLTSGHGKLLGIGVNDTLASAKHASILPTRGVERFDPKGITFSNERFRFGPIEGLMYVEAFVDRLPQWWRNMPGSAARWPGLPALTPVSTSTLAPEGTQDRHALPESSRDGEPWLPRPRGRHAIPSARTKRAQDDWGTLVDAWYVREGRHISGHTPQRMRESTIPSASSSASTSASASTSTSTSTSTAASTAAPAPSVDAGSRVVRAFAPQHASAMDIGAHWQTPAFRRALTEVVVRARRGLLLWHLPHLPPRHRALILETLRTEAGFRPVAVNGLPLPGVLGLRHGECRLLLSLMTGEAIALDVEPVPRASDDRARLRAFAMAHDEAHRLPDVAHRELRVSLGAPERDAGMERLIDDLRDRIVRAMPRREGDGLDEQDRTAWAGVVELTCRAALALPGAHARSLAETLRNVTRAHRPAPSEVLYLNEPVAGPQTAPAMGLAYDIGTAIREFAHDVFSATLSQPVRRTTPAGVMPYPGEGPMGENAPNTPDEDPADPTREATDFVAAFVDHVHQWRIVDRVRGDIASLIESGIGNADFAAAMLGAGIELHDGKFGAATAAIWREVPGVGAFRARQGGAPQLVELHGADVLRNVPRGCRILSRRVADGSDPSRGYDDMLSLGHGRVAVASNVGTGSEPRFRLEAFDIARGEGGFEWSARERVWRRQGAAMRLWVQSDTPNVFAEPAPEALEPGEIDASVFLDTLLAQPGIMAMHAERTGARVLRVDDATANLLTSLGGVFAANGVTDVRYRVIAIWASAEQFRPQLSLALTGRAPPAWVTSGHVERLAADLFVGQTLGEVAARTNGTVVASEVHWRGLYVRHCGARCVKYFDFDTVDDALYAAQGFALVPGALAGDFGAGGVLLHPPGWRTTNATDTSESPLLR
ncbi:hypothetical protein AB870_01190 [Pandoraea faecigallinarum]|uniref:Uncharacterized protein n=1 Tax=Pandoraea faecigallinarum TaxID=656179 RepID=A0A0H3WR48_9BURK|nr:hypothetical protein [Pandoraea faecigallinarum]AKM29038.1 hypothetical protein AB870_01190 [Pandoraea faecigallinarum]